ncbi:NAD(P)-dependent oxidoreductase [Lactobacillus sp. DCY120]|uniref:NAD(P)-dependent oxidoreductase n=1 Tax=Bombilactobacillus apium TaxID=2675299 RepID=A0A850QXT5_9LACO|nr:NAD(P)-dependent oxidoreductase [Bombilactobacillus apium]NVY96644.1 NAD(P)-dependent oxidoreductase [Bombilactobacillus apium]
MVKIGFIGTGVMGNAIAQNLINAEYDLVVYNRTPEKADNLVAQGAQWQPNPQAVAEASDLVFTMLGFPKDVEEVYFDDHGIFAADVQNKILVDMTTSKPKLAQQIFQKGQEVGAQVVDAPVSGGDVGAKNASLTIMVGGDQASYEKLQPIFAIIGSKTNYFGPAGSGQNAKMANQIMIAGTMTGMCESLAYAQKAGLDLQETLDTISAGSAANWSLANYGPRILKEDWQPGFFSKHFLKDLRIALDSADEMDLDLPATETAKKLYKKLVKDYHGGNDGTQALIKLWWAEED